ncbi:hypothetical protein [Limnobacter sp.]|uniref:hypothetical protein n=1 Tax=Limnobacter sp. TaxID=2003368 RepID=UPI0025BD0A7A|nr:hypothetical protein [Limnobacter sp.]
MTLLVRNARAYLLSLDGGAEKVLDAHLQNWQHLRNDSIADLYRTLLHHAKNRKGMPNSIGDVERLREVFFGFDPIQVAVKCKTHKDILDRIAEKRISTAGIVDPINQRSHWVIYAKAALSAAKFLSDFPTAQSFHDFVQSFYKNHYSRLALPLLLKEELFGFGFALACDFLKESGYKEFVKPDTHLNDICRAAGITTAESDFGVFKDVVAYCTEHGLVPYEFDKLIWLVGSGNFYLTNQKLPVNKEYFISTWLQRDG